MESFAIADDFELHIRNFNFYQFLEFSISFGASKGFGQDLFNITMDFTIDDIRSSSLQKDMSLECYHGTKVIHADALKYSIQYNWSDSTSAHCTLGIRNFTVDDMGMYQCRIRLFGIQHPSYIVRLNVVPSFSTKRTSMSFARVMENRKHFIESTLGWHRHNDKILFDQVCDLETVRTFLEWFPRGPSEMWEWCALIVIFLIHVVLVTIVYPKLQDSRRTEALELLKVLQNATAAQYEENNMSYVFDIFLSHDTADSEFVRSELLQKLEHHGYRVCYGPRDSDINRRGVHNSAIAIKQSRRTIFVFSPEFYNNDWCANGEFLAVYSGILDRPSTTDRLVIIRYKHCSVSNILKQYVYLDWTDAVKRQTFFNDLLSEIGPPLNI